MERKKSYNKRSYNGKGREKSTKISGPSKTSGISTPGARVPPRLMRNYSPIAIEYPIAWSRPVVDRRYEYEYACTIAGADETLHLHDNREAFNATVIHNVIDVMHANVPYTQAAPDGTEMPALYTAAERLYAYMRQVNKTNVSYTVLDVYSYLWFVTEAAARAIDAVTMLKLAQLVNDKAPELASEMQSCPASALVPGTYEYVRNIRIAPYGLEQFIMSKASRITPYILNPQNYGKVKSQMMKLASELEMLPMPKPVAERLLTLFGKVYADESNGSAQIYINHVSSIGCEVYYSGVQGWQIDGASTDFKVPWSTASDPLDQLVSRISALYSSVAISNMIGDLRNVPELVTLHLPEAMAGVYPAPDIVNDQKFFEKLENAGSPYVEAALEFVAGAIMPASEAQGRDVLCVDKWTDASNAELLELATATSAFTTLAGQWASCTSGPDSNRVGQFAFIPIIQCTTALPSFGGENATAVAVSHRAPSTYLSAWFGTTWFNCWQDKDRHLRSIISEHEILDGKYAEMLQLFSM